jgi:hypothetical protein
VRDDEDVLVSASARLGAVEIALESGDTRVSVLYTPAKAREFCAALTTLATLADSQMPTF